MAGIAGIEARGRQEEVGRMLRRILHRGRAGHVVLENYEVTLGAVWTSAQASRVLSPGFDKQPASIPEALVKPAELACEWRPFAEAVALPGGLLLARDRLGVRPLYYGYTRDEHLCFASEVKALLEVTQEVNEFPPGCIYQTHRGFSEYARLQPSATLDWPPAQIVAELRRLLEQAVERRISDRIMGSLLSGGLDSNVIAALARPRVLDLHTFAGGLEGAPDLEFARAAADFLKTHHHEVIVTMDDLLRALPEVIYALESFDTLLVRSTLVNYLVSRAAAGYVGAIFTGEGGDELFAGYDYLQNLQAGQLPAELLDITRQMHRNALQRVDRSAAAHGLVVHVPFLDGDVVDFAVQIPVKYRLLPGDPPVEKWILRKALENALPGKLLWRRKAKFWEGAGVGDRLEQFAAEKIPLQSFIRERLLPNGWVLNSPEELMYYRIFKEHFGEMENLSWMGRTKTAPIH